MGHIYGGESDQQIKNGDGNDDGSEDGDESERDSWRAWNDCENGGRRYVDRENGAEEDSENGENIAKLGWKWRR